MIRYLLILLLGGAAFVGLSYAWPQDATPPVKKEQPAQERADQKQTQEELKNLFEPLENGRVPQKEDRIFFRQLPPLKLKGLMKFKDRDPVALLEVDGKEVFRVRKGEDQPDPAR